jgi:MFS family permease
MRSGWLIPPGLDRRVWQMAIARSINTMGLSLVMSFLGIYVVHGRGYSAATYGLIALAANLGQSMSSAWAGALSDRIGRRPLITTALFVRSGFIALLGTQVALDAPLWSLGANIVIASTLRGCFEPVAYALVADVVRDDQRVAAFGIQRMGTNLGWAIGPALGGILTLVMPYGTVFYIAAAGMIGGAIITLGVAEPVRKSSLAAAPRDDLLGALREGIADRVMRMLLLGTLLCALLETQMFSTFSIYLIQEIDLTKADVGLLYALNGLAVLVLQMPALALIRRLGLRTVLPWSSLLDALGFALIGLVTGLPGGALAILVLTCAEVLFDPAHQAAVAAVADPARRGRAFGVVGFASTIGIAFAPLLGGFLFDTIGGDHLAMWLTIATIGGAQTLCFFLFVRRHDGQRAATPARPAAVDARRDPEV